MGSVATGRRHAPIWASIIKPLIHKIIKRKNGK